MNAVDPAANDSCALIAPHGQRTASLPYDIYPVALSKFRSQVWRHCGNSAQESLDLLRACPFQLLPYFQMVSLSHLSA